MRLVEVLLFVLPIGVFLVWRALSPSGGPSRGLVIGVTLSVAVLALLLIALRQTSTAPPGSAYIPSRQEGGRIVPGHLAPPEPGR